MHRVSAKQKCLKWPPKLGEANVLLSQFNGQTVPQRWSGDPKTSVAEQVAAVLVALAVVAILIEALVAALV